MRLKARQLPDVGYKGPATAWEEIPWLKKVWREFLGAGRREEWLLSAANSTLLCHNTRARIKKAALSFLACRGGGQTHPAKIVVSCCYGMFQLSTVTAAALSLQPIAVL